MKRKVFISYAHKDGTRVRPIARKLLSLGFQVWIDAKDLQGGELWASEITQAIQECDVFLLMVSRASMKSDSVRREVNLAYGSKRRMLLLRLDAAEIPKDIAYQVTGIQWIDTKLTDWMPRLLIALGSQQDMPLSSQETEEEITASSDRKNSPEIHIGGSIKDSVFIVGNNNTVKKRNPKS